MWQKQQTGRVQSTHLSGKTPAKIEHRVHQGCTTVLASITTWPGAQVVAVETYITCFSVAKCCLSARAQNGVVQNIQNFFQAT